MRREDDRFFLFFSSPSSQAAARTPGGGLRGGPGPACGLLPPLPAQPGRICRQRRGEKKKGGKVIGNETRGNEFSLVVTPGSRGKLGSGKEAPTPKKAVPEGRPGLSPIPIPSPFPARFLSLLPRPIPFLWDKPPGKELPKPDSSIPRTASVRALHIPYIPAAHRHAHTLPAAPSYSTTIYFTVYIPH